MDRHAHILVISGPLERERIPELCARLREIAEKAPADRVLCDLSAAGRPTTATVETLARLLLIARRLGCRLELQDPCRELRDLLALMGLEEVIPVVGGLPVETRRQAEQREQCRGVEEEGDAAEPIA